jgi:ATP-dependent helicase/nuclease subunit A
MARAEAAKLLTSPTALQDEPEKAPLRLGEERPTTSYAADLGTLCHGVMELWNFATPPAGRESELRARLDQALRLTEISPDRPDGKKVRDDAFEILRRFIVSDAYERIARSEVRGREIPFVYPLTDRVNGARFMNGRIDLLYEREGRLIVADYKTSQTFGRSAEEVAATYAVQGGVYREAVGRATGRPVDFEIVFLRTGESVVLR